MQLIRIEPLIGDIIPVEKAGFSAGRRYVDQVLALTLYISSRFDNAVTKAVVFIYLTAVYDTLWRTGLIYKLINTVRSKRIVCNRRIRLFLNSDVSKTKTLKYGLPQGFVPASSLFNLYKYYLSETSARKYLFTDVLVIISQ